MNIDRPEFRRGAVKGVQRTVTSFERLQITEGELRRGYFRARTGHSVRQKGETNSVLARRAGHMAHSVPGADQLPAVPGARYLLTVNIDKGEGVVNGAMGVLMQRGKRGRKFVWKSKAARFTRALETRCAPWQRRLNKAAGRLALRLPALAWMAFPIDANQQCSGN